MPIEILSPLIGLITGSIILGILVFLSDLRRNRGWMFLALLVGELLNLATWIFIKTYFPDISSVLRTEISQVVKIITLGILFYLATKKEMRFYRNFIWAGFITLSSLMTLLFVEKVADFDSALKTIAIIFGFKALSALIYLLVSKQKKKYLLSLLISNLIILPAIFVFDLLSFALLINAWIISLIMESFIVYYANIPYVRFKKAWWLTIMANSAIFIVLMIFVIFSILNQILIRV